MTGTPYRISELHPPLTQTMATATKPRTRNGASQTSSKAKKEPRKTKGSSKRTRSESDHEDALDSDALDEPANNEKKDLKRKKKFAATNSPRKKRKVPQRTLDGQGSDGGDDALDLSDGQEVVGRVVRAPATGHGNTVLFTLPFYRY